MMLPIYVKGSVDIERKEGWKRGRGREEIEGEDGVGRAGGSNINILFNYCQRTKIGFHGNKSIKARIA